MKPWSISPYGVRAHHAHAVKRLANMQVAQHTLNDEPTQEVTRGLDCSMIAAVCIVARCPCTAHTPRGAQKPCSWLPRRQTQTAWAAIPPFGPMSCPALLISTVLVMYHKMFAAWYTACQQNIMSTYYRACMIWASEQAPVCDAVKATKDLIQLIRLAMVLTQNL